MPSTPTDRLSGLTTSVAVKAPVRAVTSGAITLSGLQTVGGVVLAEGDRVLVKNQASASANGIYNASTGDWTRAKDFDGNRDVVNGTLVVAPVDAVFFMYKVVATDPITIGTSTINFESVSVDDDADVGVQYDGTGPVAINLHDYIEDDGYNLTGFVPQNLKSALRDRSSTTDISAYLQAAVDAVADERTYGAVKIPSWRAYLETKITLTEGISIFGNGYYASDLVLVGSIVGLEYAPGVRTEIGSTFAHFTIRGESNLTPLASHLMRFVNCTGPTLIGMRLRNTAGSCLKLETLVIGTNIYGGIFESFTAYGVDVGSLCSVLNITGPRVNANAIAGTAFVGITHANGAEGIALQNVNVNGSNLLNHVLQVATGSTGNRIGVRECYAEDLAGSCIKATGTGKYVQLTVDNAQLSGADSIQVDLDNSVAHEDIVIKNVRNGGASGGMKLISLGSTRNFDVSNMSVSAGVRLNGYTGFTHIRKEEDGRIYLDGRTYGTAGPFTQSNVTASQTNVALAGSRWTAPRAGSITGIVVKSNEARTAGTLTVEVWKNTGLAGAAGAATGLTAVLNGTNTSAKATTQDPNTDTFVAGDELFVSITTDGSWLPTTADIQAWIEYEC